VNSGTPMGTAAMMRRDRGRDSTFLRAPSTLPRLARRAWVPAQEDPSPTAWAARHRFWATTAPSSTKWSGSWEGSTETMMITGAAVNPAHARVIRPRMAPTWARISGSLTTTNSQGCELRPDGAHRPASRMASNWSSVTGLEANLRALRRSRIAIRVGLSITPSSFDRRRSPVAAREIYYSYSATQR